MSTEATDKPKSLQVEYDCTPFEAFDINVTDSGRYLIWLSSTLLWLKFGMVVLENIDRTQAVNVNNTCHTCA